MGKGDVTMKFDAQTAKFIQAIEKARSKLKQVGDEGKDVGNKFGGLGKFANKLGKDISNAFTSPLAGIGAFAAATAAATSILMKMNAERERGAKLSSDSEIGLAQLAQLAGGDSKKLKQLVDASKSTFKEGGSASLTDAASQIFTLESAGELKDRKFFSSLFGIADSESLIRSGKTLQKSFGKDETGSLKDLTSKAFAASKGSSATKVGPLLVASSRSAAFASGLGLSDEEVLAATSVIATGAGTAERGGTQLTSFLKKIGEKEEDFIDPETGEKVEIAGKFKTRNIKDKKTGEIRKQRIINLKTGEFERTGVKFQQKPAFVGLSLRESIEKIRAKNLTLPQLTKFLGDSEAVQGFNALDKNLDTKGGFSDTLKDVTQAEKERKIHKIIASTNKVAAIRLPKLERIAKAELELEELESFSPDEHEINTIIAKDTTKSIQKGEGGLARNIRVGIQKTAQVFGASPETVKNITEATDTVSLPGTEMHRSMNSFMGFLGLNKSPPQVSESRRNFGDEAPKSRRER